MKYELRKNHQGAQRVFAAVEVDENEAILLGLEVPSSYPYLLASVEAETWVEAKRLFGLPLSEIQTKLASGKITHFELFGRHWCAADLEPLNQSSPSHPTKGET